MSSLSLVVKSLSIIQGTAFKLSSALFTVGATDYSLSISVLGGSLYSNGVEVGASGSFSLADLKAGKVSFLADGLSVPSFFFQAQANGFSSSAEVQPVLSYKAVNQAPILSVPGLGSDAEVLLKGGSLTITRDMINATDAETPFAGNICFKITKVAGGSFLLNGFAAKSFSLADIDAGSVSFKHDGKLVAPSFTLSAIDSDGKASIAKSTALASVHFDGSHVAEASSITLHEIAIKAPLAITEGATLKLTVGNLPIVVPVNMPAASLPSLIIRIEDSEHLSVLVSGKSGPQESFTVAELKAGLVSLLHDGSQEAPSLRLSLLNGTDELDQLQVPVAFKTLNDAPTIELNNLVFSQGSTVLLDRGLFNVEDEETPDHLSGGFVFTIKSITGLEFHRAGSSSAVTSFSLADVDKGLVSVTRLVTNASDAAYSLNVTDLTGKVSNLANGTVIFNHLPTGTVSITGMGATAREGQVLGVNNNLVDSDGLGRISYTWKDQDGQVLGTGNTLTLSRAQVGGQVQISASYRDSLGTAEQVSSAFSGTIQEAIVQPSGTLNIVGTAALGNTLQARMANLSDPAGLGTLHYAWKDQAGNLLSTSKSLYLGDDMAARQITVSVSYVNGQGRAASISSNSVTSADSSLSNDEARVLVNGSFHDDDYLAGCVLADGSHVFAYDDHLIRIYTPTDLLLQTMELDAQVLGISALPDAGFIIATKADGGNQKVRLQKYLSEGSVDGDPFFLSRYFDDSSAGSNQSIDLKVYNDGSIQIHDQGRYSLTGERLQGHALAVTQDGWVEINQETERAEIYRDDGSLVKILGPDSGGYNILPYADGGFLATWQEAVFQVQSYTAEGIKNRASFSLSQSIQGDVQLLVLADQSLVAVWRSPTDQVHIWSQKYFIDGSSNAAQMVRSDEGYGAFKALPTHDGGFIIDYSTEGIVSQRFTAKDTPDRFELESGKDLGATGLARLQEIITDDGYQILSVQIMDARGREEVRFEAAKVDLDLNQTRTYIGASQIDVVSDEQVLVRWSQTSYLLETGEVTAASENARIFTTAGEAISPVFSVATGDVVSPLTSGRFLVATQDATFKLYDAEHLLATLTTPRPAGMEQITMMNDGGFLLSGAATNNLATFQIQRYDAAGAARGSKIQLSGAGKVIALNTGGFAALISFSGAENDPDARYAAIFYDAAGNQVTTISNLEGNLWHSTALADTAGGFTLVQGTDHGLYAQHVTASGSQTPFYIGGEGGDVSTTDQHTWVSTKLLDGGYAVAWREDLEISHNAVTKTAYVAQRFDAFGHLYGPPTVFDAQSRFDASAGVFPELEKLTELADGQLRLTTLNGSRIFTEEVDSGVVTWHGIYGADHIQGGDAADVVTLIGIGDDVNGGRGNDRFSVSSFDFFRIDGGLATDTLELTANLNLTQVNDDKLKNLEVLQLFGDNLTLTLTSTDVLAMTDADHILRISGSTGSVDLEVGWSFGGATRGFETYTKDGATLLVQQELNVV